MILSVFFQHAKVAAEQRECPLQLVLQTFRQAGIETVEVDVPDATAETRERLAEAGLRAGSVPIWFNFAHAPFDPKDTSFLEAPLSVGAKHVLILPEIFEEGDDREAAFEKVVEGIQAVSEHCHAAGITPSIEDFDDLRSPTCRSADLARLLEAVPSLGLNLDTGNFAIVGEDPFAMIERYASRIVYVHAKDRAAKPFFGDGGLVTEAGETLYPCPVGRGIIPFSDLFSRLKAAGVSVPVSIECYGVREMLPAVLASADFLRSVLS